MFSHNKQEAKRLPAGFQSDALIMDWGSCRNNSYLSPILTVPGKPFSFLPFVWLNSCGDSPPVDAAAWAESRATLSVHCRHSAVDASVLYVMCWLKCMPVCEHTLHDKCRPVCVHRLCSCSHTSNNTRKVRVVKARTRENEEQRVDLPQVLRLCINKQDLLDCLWHFCSVGRSVSSLIFNKTSQPSNAIPPSVSRY